MFRILDDPTERCGGKSSITGYSGKIGVTLFFEGYWLFTGLFFDFVGNIVQFFLFHFL